MAPPISCPCPVVANGILPTLPPHPQDFWQRQASRPFHARNRILAAVCPQLHGLFLVKLAVMLGLAGGVARQEGGSHIRGDVHTLLIGDPGLGGQQSRGTVAESLSHDGQCRA